MNIPEFILPKDVRDITDAQFDKMLEVIQEVRLRAYHKYMEAEKQKMEERDEKLRTKLTKQNEMLMKEIIRADKVVIALNKRINTIRSLQLELGELPDE